MIMIYSYHQLPVIFTQIIWGWNMSEIWSRRAAHGGPEKTEMTTDDLVRSPWHWGTRGFTSCKPWAACGWNIPRLESFFDDWMIGWWWFSSSVDAPHDFQKMAEWGLECAQVWQHQATIHSGFRRPSGSKVELWRRKLSFRQDPSDIPWMYRQRDKFKLDTCSVRERKPPHLERYRKYYVVGRIFLHTSYSIDLTSFVKDLPPEATLSRQSLSLSQHAVDFILFPMFFSPL